jgi:hypothetical protein
MANKRFKPAIRRELVLKAAIEAARKPGGWARLTRQIIAEHADCSEGLVSRYLGDMPDARKAIMRYAIKHEMTEIIAQSIVAHDGYAVKKWLPEALKQKSLLSLLG